MLHIRRIAPFLAIASFVTLIGCSDEVPTPTPATALVTATPAPSATLTPAPSATPTAIIAIDSPDYGVSSYVFSNPVIAPPMDFSGKNYGQVVDPSCTLEVLDIPIETIKELVLIDDDDVFRERLEDLIQQVTTTRTIEEDDENIAIYLQFGMMVERIAQETETASTSDSGSSSSTHCMW